MGSESAFARDIDEEAGEYEETPWQDGGKVSMDVQIVFLPETNDRLYGLLCVW